jgi:hypothetical protein
MVVGFGLWMGLVCKGMCECVLLESLCIFRSKVWPIGSMPVIIRWLHICGMGLYVIMRTYIWRWMGYFESSDLYLWRWDSLWSIVFCVPCVR